MAPAGPAIVEPPPPPPKMPESDSGWPKLSARIDPLNWLIESRLGIELEVEILKFLSIEAVPVFVTSESSPSLRQSFGGIVSQHSNGLGPLAGASIGTGFWLSGKPLKGTVLRVIYANYAYTYTASRGGPDFDEVSHVDQHLYGYIGSHSNFGLFTMAGGFGLGVELNKEQRCFTTLGRVLTSGCPNDALSIALDGTRSLIGDLHSSTYPVELMFRFSLGVTF